MNFPLCRIGAAIVFLFLFPQMALAKDYTATVSAPNRSYRNVPVTVSIPAPSNFAGVAVMHDRAPVPAQSRLVGGRAEVSWIVAEIAKGATLRYTLSYEKNSRPAPASGVIIDRNGGNLDIRINNELFATYNTTTGPNKPYFYPMFAPGQKRIVRGYPIEVTAADVSKDHPHHRGLWFTHGEVNGEDYWSEGPKTAKTVSTGFGEVTSGPVYGFFQAKTDWVNTKGDRIAEDLRNVIIYNVPDARMMDFYITITPASGPVDFGDTKEGMFGLRLPDSMRATGGDGHIVMSTGLHDDAGGDLKNRVTWGTRADWVDYYGTSEGAPVGIAILDDPKNFRHPTYWHVRDYGLFAANPFGIHDFVKGQPKGAGAFKLEPGKSFTFKYRVYIHKGSTTDAHIADVWDAFADPPKVEVK